MTCTPAFEALWEHFHASRSDTVKLPRKLLEPVFACAVAAEQPRPAVDTGKRKSLNVSVARTELFTFLRTHGAYCPEEKRNQ